MAKLPGSSQGAGQFCIVCFYSLIFADRFSMF